ncbi:2-aminoethylphosphonate--pyruvate transaminase [Pontibacillus yanchengensis]|uniref:2-aminoethylphosphonate--pyruvate transaminase n=1 Tax=Pontibacillus yanchengensis Y32 TaxID=1385514 RepID=A0A0A2TIB2_9BACI|nr:2-aminoethylphosphonate--pyruvate transaminase [Pontibacillus yanchengensis]KGP73806.1 2-aminoethylphosphonate--pyruvate aminotransferase [Pontibacillus yanchengensis Y32]
MYEHNQNPYMLLTPGPLTTSTTVKETMLADWCTWDDDYKSIVQSIRHSLLHLADVSSELYTTVLMQGSGTFSVESVIGSTIPHDGKLLVLMNGAYGERIGKIADRLGIDWTSLPSGETEPPDLNELTKSLEEDASITHVAVVHCETTTGMLNPIKEVSNVVKAYNKTFIVDAMSSFGGIEFSMQDLDIDFLISSANKCIQGVPGFGFVISKRSSMEKCKGLARSLSLDLYDQWVTMEEQEGKWRFTSPTHTVRAFRQALDELQQEGGIQARQDRYTSNQRRLVEGMRQLGFTPLLPDELQSPIITPFYHPDNPGFDFETFYKELKLRGFVIYPGKVTNLETFRIGNIGVIDIEDIERLLVAVEQSMYWKQTIA